MTRVDGEPRLASAPVRLAANQPPDRFYLGGAAIARFRGDADPRPRTPEDWVGSTTSVRGAAPTGQTRLPDGVLLADAVAADPELWLGPRHVAAYGADAMLLVKLLDAGQRLPVHAHPHSDFAARELAELHGKAEAWYILSPGTVHLGVRDDIAAEELLDLVARQDTARLLSLMHEVRVRTHDTVYVPPGLLHAIGEGILLAEVQEPSDLSILLEWSGFELDGATDGHLGLGFERALRAVETTRRSSDDIRALVRSAPADGPTLASGAEPYFRLDRATTDRDLPSGLAIVIALADGMTLETNTGTIDLPRGSTTLVPAAAGSLRLRGTGDVLVARPPEAP